ncbi:carboxy terminal-processing peptidase [Halomonas binhaiensis]|uniref:Carboxy terminal-processing peptidase n=1 Tax=Halomonas binhaiensis TaxID=2562282 RepID=A0A5C1NK97_9GAMM|nr:carboxy terminal-processing peptidase [Halomonas binhaiensis]QEM82229.1 carboxy terminal-processing peptidase [Halomonas binhaiensis]
MSLFESAGRALALSLLVAAPTALALPSPGEDQRQAAMEVAESLRYGHYADVRLDDQWSTRAFQRYLDILDSQRAYLLQSDVDDFSDLRTTMDDSIKDGSLGRTYELYGRYQDRAEERLDWLLSQLDKLDMSFDGDERLVLERKDEPWAKNESELDALWQKRLANAALTLSISGQDDDEVVDTLRERYQTQKHRLEQTNADDILTLVMAGATSTVDPHTEYLSPRQGESFDIQMRLSLEGIGALLQSDGEYVKVASLVPGGPADKGGSLKPADRIIGVGQEGENITNVVGMRLDDVVELIRGPKGSKVRLEIVPGESADTTRSTVITITRDTVKLEDQAASSEVIEVKREDGSHKVGVIKVPAFYVDFDAWRAGEENYRSTTRDVAAEIAKLKAEKVEGIVLDLRNNGGGALQEANSMIGLFIDRGPTVQVRDARGRISLYGDTESGTDYDGPLVVLVNRLSASASEIFAGAIQDYGRGLIVGSNTFGKGTVQTLNDLSYGQIKLTRAKFYRISGESTQNRGVKPDIAYPSLLDPNLIGESALDDALPWDTVREVQYRTYGTPRQYLKKLQSRHQQRADESPNFHYLEQRADLASKLREQLTSVSLNREKRQQEANQQDDEMLSLENERREALDLEPLKEWSEARESEEEATTTDESKEDQPVDRAEVEESAEILLDFVDLGPSWQFATKLD